jgi:hypothetical protein
LEEWEKCRDFNSRDECKGVGDRRRRAVREGEVEDRGRRKAKESA